MSCVTKDDCEKLGTTFMFILEYWLNALLYLFIWDFNLRAFGVPE